MLVGLGAAIASQRPHRRGTAVPCTDGRLLNARIEISAFDENGSPRHAMDGADETVDNGAAADRNGRDTGRRSAQQAVAGGAGGAGTRT